MLILCHPERRQGARAEPEAHRVGGEIEEHLRLYRMERPYIEAPRVQLDRLLANAKKAEDSERTTDDGEQEVQDEAETVSAE